jgi:hypothetical protein
LYLTATAGNEDSALLFFGGIPLSPRGTPALPQPALIFLLFDPPRTLCYLRGGFDILATLAAKILPFGLFETRRR